MISIDLHGATAFISGSSQGIGHAIALRLAQAGAQVVLNGRSEERVVEAAHALQAAGAAREQVIAAPGDLTTDRGLRAVLDAAGDVDILVNSLGIFEPQPALELPDEQWQRFWDVNVLTAVHTIRGTLPGRLSRDHGRIITIASDSVIAIPAEMIHYGATKSALLTLTRGYAKEAAGTSVTVNSVIAGPTHSEGVEELVGPDLPWPEAQTEFMKRHRSPPLLQRLIERSSPWKWCSDPSVRGFRPSAREVHRCSPRSRGWW